MAHPGLIDIDVEKQVAALSKELGALKKAVARRGSDFYDGAGDTLSNYLSELSDRVSSSLPVLGKRARAVERAAHDHPVVAAAVGLFVIGVVAGLMIGRTSPSASTPARPASRRVRTAANSRR